MADLNSRLAEADRDKVIRDSVRLIDDEVARKSGVTGAVLKTGYKVVAKLKNGQMISKAVNHLLDDFTGALDPMYQDFLSDSGADSFEKFVGSRTSEGADLLLGVTDQKIHNAENKVIVKTYEKLRGSAKKHVEEALPGVGRLIDEHAPK